MNYIREAEEILKNLDNLKISVENMTDKLKELKADTGYKGIDYSGMPMGNNIIHDDKIINKLI
ncbi:hypothetical protein, partial [Clostridium sp.]|uniref:hypothetical protein n=1 Tax=Clostridium sp. TaxID=1506 RepID=UPI0034648CF0